MCVICETHPRVGKKKFCNVLACKKDFEAARDNAKRQGVDQEMAFKEAETDVAQLRKLVLDFARACPSKGSGHKRPNFDFVKFATIKEETHVLDDYAQREWMEQEQYVLHRVQMFGNTRKRALEKWDEMVEQPESVVPKRRDGETQEDGTRSLRCCVKVHDFSEGHFQRAVRNQIIHSTRDRRF